MGPLQTRLMLVTIVILVITAQAPSSRATPIGMCYGRNGDNLPSPTDVISLYNRCGIEFIRLFEPNPEVLDALRGSNLLVSIGVRNEDIQNLASSQDAANAWVSANIVAYKDDVTFHWITVGNEAIPGPYAAYIAQAMNNIYNAVNSAGVNNVRVTTVVATNVLAVSYPPSAGVFTSEVTGIMNDVTTFLAQWAAPLMLNVYPYFAYASDPDHISPEYAIYFHPQEPVVDGDYKYYNLFDAMVDAVNAALEKINANNIAIAISESGWPSAGNDPYTSVENAKAYNDNLFNHVLNDGTPRRPNQLMDTFFFAMFNEDQKSAGVQQNFGFFSPDMHPIYPIFANCVSK